MDHLFDVLGYFFFHIDKDYNLVTCNQEAERLFNTHTIFKNNRNIFNIFQKEFSLKNFFEHAELQGSFSFIIPINSQNYSCVISFDIENKSFHFVGRKAIDSINNTKSILDYLEELVVFMPGNFYWKDKNGRYLGCNNLLIKTLGMNSSSEIIGKTDYDLWPGQAEELFRNDREVITSGQPIYLHEAVSLDGRKMFFAVIKAPLKDDNGNIIGIVGNSLDITEQVEMQKALKEAKEKAEKANKAKSDFLAVVSHELRTPLTGILGMVEILQMEEIDEIKKKEYLGNIDTASKHLLTIVNNILDFAKLNENKCNLVFVSFDLADIFEKTLDILEAKAIEKNITLKVYYPTSLPRYFIGDPKALLQIFINVIGNAIKFTHEGGITITVKELERKENQITFQVEIKDTGIGIPSDKLEAIFERFEQVNSSSVRAYGGTGLGLSVTQKLVKLMGGKILVESQMGKGSTFTIVLPFELDSKHLSLKKSKSEKNESKALMQKNTKILLVEDDALVQLVHKHKFEKLGCQVDIASNGAEALQCYKKNLYDIAFVDIGLPDMTGNEVIQHIRKKEGGKKHMCVIALTAYSDDDNRKRARDAGADVVLSKPIADEELAKTLEKYFY